jgi:hypothetical protein
MKNSNMAQALGDRREQVHEGWARTIFSPVQGQAATKICSSARKQGDERTRCTTGQVDKKHFSIAKGLSSYPMKIRGGQQNREVS